MTANNMTSPHTFLKKIYYLTLILLFGIVSGQNKQLKQIDNLLSKAKESNLLYRDLDELKYAKQASRLAENAGDSKRIAESYLAIAEALSHLQLTKESLVYIDKAFAQQYAKDNVLFQVKLKEVKSINYLELQFLSQSIEEQVSSIKLIEKQKDPESLNRFCTLYGNLGNNLLRKNSLDSASMFYRKAKNILKILPQEYKSQSIPSYYISMGYLHTFKKNYDSAYYYISHAYNSKIEAKDSILVKNYMSFGNYYYYKKEYKKAVDNYQKALKNIEDQKINSNYFREIYYFISINYDSLRDRPNKEKYERRYKKEDSLFNTNKSKYVDYALNVILKDKNIEHQNKKKETHFWIGFGVLLLLISLFSIYQILHKKLKKKEILISEASNSLLEKDDLISQKHIETTELKQKVNDAYSEVINLAKENDSSFYFRFQEVYPDFQKKLLEYSPGLRTSELILCAYTFLGFTIKDVADYTFKSVNTIRNRKQSLRKKFNIPTEQDMGIWLRNITEQNPQ